MRGPAGGKLGHAPLGKEKAPRGLRAGRVAGMCAGELQFCDQTSQSSAFPASLGHEAASKTAGFQLSSNFMPVLSGQIYAVIPYEQ